MKKRRKIDFHQAVANASPPDILKPPKITKKHPKAHKKRCAILDTNLVS